MVVALATMQVHPQEEPADVARELVRLGIAVEEEARRKEEEAERALLHKIVMGLIRRCRKQIYLGITYFGESGYEQRGPLLRLFQQVLRLGGAEGLPIGEPEDNPNSQAE